MGEDPAHGKGERHRAGRTTQENPRCLPNRDASTYVDGAEQLEGVAPVEQDPIPGDHQEPPRQAPAAAALGCLLLVPGPALAWIKLHLDDFLAYHPEQGKEMRSGEGNRLPGKQRG